MTGTADLLVRGGVVVTPGGRVRADIACRAGRIVALGDLAGSWSAETVVDAAGLHVLPGVIDSQVHFREPGLTHKETIAAGTQGAVLGGVTTIFEMPNTTPPTPTAADLEAKLAIAARDAWCDHAFYIGGAAANPAVGEIASTLFTVPVVIPPVGEYVADGAARQAAWILAGDSTPPSWHAQHEGATRMVDPKPVPAVRDAYAAAQGALYDL